jgi:uroporphyrinogen decarboxylase
VIKGKGPRIDDPIRSMDQVKALKTLDDPTSSLPFVHEILSSLRCGNCCCCCC